MRTLIKFRVMVLAIGFSLTFFNLSNAQDANVSTGDEKLVTEAYNGGVAQIKFAECVKARTVSSEIKDITITMITDHANLNNKLRALAGSKNILLNSKLTSSQQKDIEGLEKKIGMDLDAEYIDMLSDSHKKSITMYEKGTRADDPDVRALFIDALPKIKHHYALILGLEDKLDKDPNNRSMKLD